MKVIKPVQVAKKLSISLATLYRLINAEKFPKPIRLSPNRVGWLESSILKWIEEQQQQEAQ